MAFDALPGMQTAHPAWMIAFKLVTSHRQVFESVQQVCQARSGAHSKGCRGSITQNPNVKDMGCRRK